MTRTDSRVAHGSRVPLVAVSDPVRPVLPAHRSLAEMNDVVTIDIGAGPSGMTGRRAHE